MLRVPAVVIAVLLVVGIGVLLIAHLPAPPGPVYPVAALDQRLGEDPAR